MVVFASSIVKRTGYQDNKVHRLVLKEDFRRCISEVGFIPSVELDGIIQREKTIQVQNVELEQAKKQQIALEVMRSKYN